MSHSKMTHLASISELGVLLIGRKRDCATSTIRRFPPMATVSLSANAAADLRWIPKSPPSRSAKWANRSLVAVRGSAMLLNRGRTSLNGHALIRPAYQNCIVSGAPLYRKSPSELSA
jgi:hypothetical protein